MLCLRPNLFCKALELNLHVIVCINKIDRPEARPDEVVDEVLELLMDLDASDEQLDCPFLYASAKTAMQFVTWTMSLKNMAPLFETILDTSLLRKVIRMLTQVLISTIDYNEYVGRIGVGKVQKTVTIRVNQELVVVNHHDPDKKSA